MTYVPHRFDSRNWKLLESEWRRKILPVDPAMELLRREVRIRNIAFDIGAGTGYFTKPLSSIFKRVYAVEVNLELAKILASKGLKNVGIIISDKPVDVDFTVDLVAFVDSLHEITCREDYARWCSDHAEHVLVIDWRKDAEVGPPKEDRIDPATVKSLFKDFEFREYEMYPYHFTLLGKKVKV